VSVGRARIAVLAAAAAAASACGTAQTRSPSAGARTPPVPTSTSSAAVVNCSAYGGCDVEEQFGDGTETIIPLRTPSFETASARASHEAQREDVFDAVVVGDSPPHTILSAPYYG
jgi:hypothetical protein